MKLFSFKKKKPAILEAKEGKKQLRRPGDVAAPKVLRSENEIERSTVPASQIPTPIAFGSVSRIIVRPRVTEKATDLSQKSNVYVFDILPRVTKQQVALGIKELYGIVPDKVHIVPVPAKKVRGRRGEGGVKTGGKKAYVYLKKGDTIEIV
ncbi:50S ribosomal protein L23 [Candidatus Wolfebacteria bacterium]|nr:50S ribosomal protein L23 [Candidatus Wolfebacteria bacterium]